MKLQAKRVTARRPAMMAWEEFLVSAEAVYICRPSLLDAPAYKMRELMRLLQVTFLRGWDASRLEFRLPAVRQPAKAGTPSGRRRR